MEISNLNGLARDSEAKGDSSSHLVRVFQEQVDSSLTWHFIKWMRDVTKLPIFVKVLHPGAAAMMGTWLLNCRVLLQTHSLFIWDHVVAFLLS